MNIFSAPILSRNSAIGCVALSASIAFRYRYSEQIFLAVSLAALLALLIAWQIDRNPKKTQIFNCVCVGLMLGALPFWFINDTDRDGIRDAWDPYPRHNFPQDYDRDGIPDLMERAATGAKEPR
jgi:hypothetical protein